MRNKNYSNKKRYYILEITWLILFIICAILGIYLLIFDKNNFNFTFVILSALSLLMYLLRRYMRRNNMYNSKSE